MNRLQFGIRHLLLIVALLATCFAWFGAVRSKERSEREFVLIQCSSRLRAGERQRAALLATIKRAPTNPNHMSDAYRRSLQHRIADLKDTEASIDLMHAELNALK